MQLVCEFAPIQGMPVIQSPSFKSGLKNLVKDGQFYNYCNVNDQCITTALSINIYSDKSVRIVNYIFIKIAAFLKQLPAWPFILPASLWPLNDLCEVLHCTMLYNISFITLSTHEQIFFCLLIKVLFHSSQKPTRKVAARTFIQSQYLKESTHCERASWLLR